MNNVWIWAMQRRLTRWGVVPRLVLCGLCMAKAAAGQGSAPTLALKVASELGPPGGWAQIKVFASSPALIASGQVSMDLDPTVFGPIAQIAVFSATRDQIGFANVSGGHMDAHFSSPSGGIGQSPGLPVFTATVPVLASAKPGAGTISVDPGSGWSDPQGNQYSMAIATGAFTVGGALSVQSVAPGGGLLPAGTVVEIDGTGFDASTGVAIDGVSLASVQYVSRQVVKVTLGGATEMTGKRVRVTSGNGAEMDYFASLPSAPTDPPADPYSALLGRHMILPFTSYTSIHEYDSILSFNAAAGFAILNPNLAPVTLTFLSVSRNAPSQSQYSFFQTAR